MDMSDQISYFPMSMICNLRFLGPFRINSRCCKFLHVLNQPAIFS